MWVFVQKMEKKKIYVVDGSSFIYRAYHALPELITAKGQPTNAIYGFTTMMLKLIEDEQPEYIAVAMDARRPTWRDEIYPEYKANRPPMPEDLVQQLPYFTQILEALGVPFLHQEGYEADDLIATLVREARERGFAAVIISGDKDLMSLVGDSVVMNDTLKGKIYTVLEVEKKLIKFVPKEFMVDAHHWLILLGRYTCVARKPRCGSCLIEDLCEFKNKTE